MTILRCARLHSRFLSFQESRLLGFYTQSTSARQTAQALRTLCPVVLKVQSYSCSLIATHAISGQQVHRFSHQHQEQSPQVGQGPVKNDLRKAGTSTVLKEDPDNHVTSEEILIKMRAWLKQGMSWHFLGTIVMNVL